MDLRHIGYALIIVLAIVVGGLIGYFVCSPKIEGQGGYRRNQQTSKHAEPRTSKAMIANKTATDQRRKTTEAEFVRGEEACNSVEKERSSNGGAPVPVSAREELRLERSEIANKETTADDFGRLASDLNDRMDELLARPEIPSDYCDTMIALFRDRTENVVIRDFAVQHIGLYAETVSRRGRYDADSREAGNIRQALDDAASETQTIVAAAAFRALDDLSDFDARVDRKRLDSRLAACADDATASPAARVMAVQLCGERKIGASRSSLERIAADPKATSILKVAAATALRSLAANP